MIITRITEIHKEKEMSELYVRKSKYDDLEEKWSRLELFKTKLFFLTEVLIDGSGYFRKKKILTDIANFIRVNDPI